MSTDVLTMIEIQDCVCVYVCRADVQLNVLLLTDTHVMFNYLDHLPPPLLSTSQLSSKLVKADRLSRPICFFSFSTPPPFFFAKTSVFLILIARCDPLHHCPSCPPPFFFFFFGVAGQSGHARPSHLSMCRGV